MNKKDQKKVKAANARSKSLSAEERSLIAKKAAAARWADKLPVAVKAGDIEMGELKISCAVLPDETRVLSERAVTKAFGAKRGGSHWRRKKAGDPGADLPVFLSAKNISSNLKNDLKDKLLAPIEYQIPESKAIAHGIEASLLPDICVELMDMQEAGLLQTSQQHIAVQAKALHRSLAKVGIIALVDEATGYQAMRDKQALAAILDKYFRSELATWAKKFPDEFYKQIFRLRKWDWNELSTKRPGVVGKYTNDLVYERIAPELLNRLTLLNPKDSRGRRKNKHHQWLSIDVGDPALAQHLYAVVALMKASSDWPSFKKLINQALPKKGQTMEMDI